MSMFASYFWLWSIVGLLGLILLSTLGALLNMTGFFTPIKRATHWLDGAPTLVQAGMVILIFGLVFYPWLIHHLWAEATAGETRRVFESLPTFPGARAEPLSEQMGGLFDPTGTDGTYIIGSYGTTADYSAVRTFYERGLADRGWVPQATAGRDRRPPAAPGRIEFRDDADPRRSQYEIVVVQLPPGTREVSAETGSEPTVFSVRLGVVDPRATTQVAWFIDCLVHRAPTFPSCEALGWNPVEHALIR